MYGNKLEFGQFGDFDSFGICRSLAPMDPLNLPTPIATNLQTMYYFDDDVSDLLDRNIHYRVLVYRDTEILVSDEVVSYISSFSAPYDLIAEFKMTSGIELNWKVDGVVDEQRYYCSETAFTVETKPTPKTILASDVRSYVDTNIIEGLTYYVCVGSVRNNVEKLSEIISVKSSDNAISILRFTDNLTDKKGRVWTPAITPVFTVDGLQLNDNDLGTAWTDDFGWVNNQYTIEAFVKASSWATWSEPGQSHVNGIPRLLGRMEKTNDSNYWSFGPVASGKVHFYYYQSGQKLLVASLGTIPLNEIVHISFCKDDTHAYVSIAGVVNSVALPSISLPASSSNISLGKWNNQGITGICGGLKITKGEALYTANFTPPARPF